MLLFLLMTAVWACWREVEDVPLVHASEDVTAHVYFPYTDLTIRGTTLQSHAAPMSFLISSNHVNLIRDELEPVQTMGALQVYYESILLTLNTDPFVNIESSTVYSPYSTLRVEAALCKLYSFVKTVQPDIDITPPETPLQYQIINALILLEHLKRFQFGLRPTTPLLYRNNNVAVQTNERHVEKALKLAFVVTADLSVKSLAGFCEYIESQSRLLVNSSSVAPIMSLQDQVITDSELIECHQRFAIIESVEEASSDYIKTTVRAIIKVLIRLELVDTNVIDKDIHIQYLMEWMSDALQNGRLEKAPSRIIISDPTVSHYNRFTMLHFWKQIPQPKSLRQYELLSVSVLKAMFVRLIIRFHPKLYHKDTVQFDQKAVLPFIASDFNIVPAPIQIANTEENSTPEILTRRVQVFNHPEILKEVKNPIIEFPDEWLETEHIPTANPTRPKRVKRIMSVGVEEERNSKRQRRDQNAHSTSDEICNESSGHTLRTHTSKGIPIRNRALNSNQ